MCFLLNWTRIHLQGQNIDNSVRQQSCPVSQKVAWYKNIQAKYYFVLGALQFLILKFNMETRKAAMKSGGFKKLQLSILPS